MWLDCISQEQGDLKLRVRALESERAFQRVAAVQKTVGTVSLALYLPSGILPIVTNQTSLEFNLTFHQSEKILNFFLLFFPMFQ